MGLHRVKPLGFSNFLTTRSDKTTIYFWVQFLTLDSSSCFLEYGRFDFWMLSLFAGFSIQRPESHIMQHSPEFCTMFISHFFIYWFPSKSAIESSESTGCTNSSTFFKLKPNRRSVGCIGGSKGWRLFLFLFSHFLSVFINLFLLFVFLLLSNHCLFYFVNQVFSTNAQKFCSGFRVQGFHRVGNKI